jgi:hypothetical protein
MMVASILVVAVALLLLVTTAITSRSNISWPSLSSITSSCSSYSSKCNYKK